MVKVERSDIPRLLRRSVVADGSGGWEPAQCPELVMHACVQAVSVVRACTSTRRPLCCTGTACMNASLLSTHAHCPLKAYVLNTCCSAAVLSPIVIGSTDVASVLCCFQGENSCSHVTGVCCRAEWEPALRLQWPEEAQGGRPLPGPVLSCAANRRAFVAAQRLLLGACTGPVRLQQCKGPQHNRCRLLPDTLQPLSRPCGTHT